MPSKSRILPFLSTLALALALGTSQAQTPPESTSKVKRVLLYEKIGGWISVDGIAEVRQTFFRLAESKGFQVDTLSSDSGLTPENLKRYQVIVWNNNTNGASSVPSAAARRAVMDYLRQGGGWMLLGLAGDHAASWRELDSTMGTGFTRWSFSGQADLVADSAAKSHPELRNVMASIPDSFRLTATWLSFRNTVRPLPGVTILYNARNGQRNSSGGSTLLPLADGSGEHPYVWAREAEKGRFLFNGVCHRLGFDANFSMAAQADSAVPRMYWTSLRWLAGDFRNGCTDPASARFDPEARIDDGSCSLTGLKPEAPSSPPGIRLAGRRLRVDGMPTEGIRITLRDLRGALIWRRTLSAGDGDILLDASLQPGVYLLEARASGRRIILRAAIP